MSKETIVNKVKANTKLISIDLADMFYDDTPIVVLDIKDFLHMGLLLREVEFRSYLEQYDWNQFGNKYLSVICSTDAIIPPWSWMLITTHASPFQGYFIFHQMKSFMKYIKEVLICMIGINTKESIFFLKDAAISIFLIQFIYWLPIN